LASRVMKKELEIELRKLIKEKNELSFLKEQSFSTEEEFEVFLKENKLGFQRLKELKKKIMEIQENLMSSSNLMRTVWS
jgi:hypothetical protein